MQGGTIKSIVIFVLLAIFAFIAGSFVTDGLTEALIPTVMIVGAFGLMALGKNSWWLLFLAPPVLQIIPIAALQNFPVAYFCCGLVLAYWLLMSLTGQVRLTWQGVKWLDIATLILFTYFLSTWVRHPVTIDAFTSYTDEGEQAVGGKDYIMCIGGMVFYVAVSMIPMQIEKMANVMRFAFWMTLVVCVILAVKCFFSPNQAVGVVESLEIEAQSLDGTGETTRNKDYIELGSLIFKYLFSKYSMLVILGSPLKLLLVAFALFCVLISGFRSALMHDSVIVLIMSYYHRQFIIVLLIGIGVWGGLILLSHGGIIENLPYPIQRTMASIPGVEVSKLAEDLAKDSTEWREKKWDLVLNPHQGLVDDYVWGEGFAQYMSDIKREHYLFTTRRNTHLAGRDVYSNPERGGLHSGWVTAIYTTGYVGLVILSVWLLLFLVAFFRACSVIWHIPQKEFLYIAFLAFPGVVLDVYVVTATWTTIFVTGIRSAAIMKVVYALARDEGMMKPMFQRKRYVPLMVEANESQPKLRVL